MLDVFSFTVNITGAALVPTFIINDTTSDQWALELQKPAPYVGVVLCTRGV